MARPVPGEYNHGVPSGSIPTTAAGRLAEAIALTPAARMAIVEGFFVASPRSSEGAFGLGRAILDFQAWEIASGRIAANGGGSAWWRAVNGMMVLDVAAATTGEAAGSPAVRTWLAYPSSGEPQRALWEAHQRSLHAGINACAGLLAAETGAEQQFAAIVIDVVDRTALSRAATDNDGLARLTERYYPPTYPIVQDSLPALEGMREKTAARLLDVTGNPFQDVGMTSTRWD